MADDPTDCEWKAKLSRGRASAIQGCEVKGVDEDETEKEEEEESCACGSFRVVVDVRGSREFP